MSDLVFILITLASFAGFALLVGAIDRRLPDPDGAEEALLSEGESAAVRR